MRKTLGKPSREKTAVYDALADAYDGLIDPSYYKRWFDYAEGFVKGMRKGLDVGCGSGIFTTEFVRRGYDMTGVDSSEKMLSKAVERALGFGVKPKFVFGRAEKFTLAKPVDFVIAMNDVVNYMKDPTPFFKATAANLAKGGVFVFDISSEYKLRSEIASHTFVLENGGTVCVWENSPVTRGESVEMRLRFFTEQDGLYRLSEENQRQYIHKTEKIKEILASCGFKTRVYGNLTHRAPSAASQRVHFVCGKRE